MATRDGQAIESLYRDNGFDCKVSTATVDDYKGKRGDVAITVNISEGPQYLVSHLQVDGVHLKNKEAILSALTSVAGQPYSELSVVTIAIIF